MIPLRRRISIQRYWLPYLIAKERRCPFAVPLRTRVQLWRRGFLSESSVIYGRAPTTLGEYLTDRDRALRTRSINRRFSELLDNKLLFETVVSGLVDVPRNYAVVSKGRIVPLGRDHRVTDVTSLIQLCIEQRGLVLKPATGGGGEGVFLLAADDAGSLHLNDTALSRSDLLDVLGACDFSLVCAFVRQAAYARAIYARTTNTIRVLTMIDPDAGTPFLAAAVHRFGNATSYPADNWTQGGFCARVDPVTGELGPAVSYPRDGTLRFHEVHPETGALIRGVRVPRWRGVLEGVLVLAHAWSRLPYVGWDLVVTDHGFTVIEGNNFTDVNLLQVHEPLLRNPRVRRFYEYHGII